MKKLIVSLSALTAFLVLFFCIALPTQAETYSGICGKNLTWDFDPDTGTLTIDGEGEMYDGSGYNSAPWYNLKSKITTVVINNSVTSIGNNAFRECFLTSINIPDSVTSIGNAAFSGCSSLTSINIPDSVTSIGVYAFRDCNSLTSVHMGDSVTNIGSAAFYNCRSLTSVHMGDSVTNIGSAAFYNCRSLTSINIPDSVTSIGHETFRGCSSLTSTNIPDGVTSIGEYAFYGCRSLTSINIPDSVTSIGQEAFGNCSSLTSINIPDSVKSIGEYAFNGCPKLEIIYCGTEKQWNNIEKGWSCLPDNHILSYHEYNYTNKDGKYVDACKYCGYTCEHDVHYYGNWTEFSETQHKRECPCGEVQYEDHDWKFEYEDQATHLEEGVTGYKCSDCGATREEPIPKLEEHEFGGNWTYCDEQQHKCECPCGEVKYAEHSYDSYEVIKVPTHSEEGIAKLVCTACGAEKTESIEKLPGDDIPPSTGVVTDTTSNTYILEYPNTIDDGSTDSSSGCGGTIGGGMLFISLISLLFTCIITKKKQQ